MKTIILAAVLFSLSVIGQTIRLHADPAVSAQADAKNKVNLSGRQRMLIQRMAKAACFATLGVDVAHHAGMAAGTLALFDDTLRALTRGDLALGLLPETDYRIVQRVSDVQALWPGFSVAVGVAARNPSHETLQAVIARDLDIFRVKNVAVLGFEQVYSEGVLKPDLAGAINVAGRQRMLSQKVGKEICMIALGIGPEDACAEMARTIALFDTSMKRLQEGDPGEGIVAPPTARIAAQLQTTNALWQEMRASLDTGLLRTGGPKPDAKTVAAMSERILVVMNRAVELYAK